MRFLLQIMCIKARIYVIFEHTNLNKTSSLGVLLLGRKSGLITLLISRHNHLFERLYVLMLAITKFEASELRRRCPNVHIVRTMKQKSRRGNYFCEETVAAIRVIKELRSGEISDIE